MYTVASSGNDWENIVSDINKIAEQRDTLPADPRIAYVSPKLKEFGPVGALTQAGSMGGSEMAAMLTTNMR